MKRILTIAGSDSGGGAGIQADLKAITVLGGYGMSVITALTAQNTVGVKGIHPVPVDFIRSQMDAVLSDIGADAAKTGMLAEPDVVRVVAEGIEKYKVQPLVVDPVMVAKSGDSLLSEQARVSIKESLFPLAHVVTPNLPEAEVLCGFPVKTVEQMKDAAKAIRAMGPKNVLIKGGHLEGKALDILYDGASFHSYETVRIDSKNTHGTGCTLSAALATFLGQGLSVRDAVEEAKRFISNAIAHGLDIGKGHGPTNPYAHVLRFTEKEEVLEELRTALNELSGMNIGALIPEVRSNFGYAVSGARAVGDVAAVPGRISQIGDRLVSFADPAFGASRHIAKIILTLIAHHPDYRSVINIRYENEVLQACEKAGLHMASFDRSDEPADVKEREGSTLEWGTQKVLKENEAIPDIVFDRGDMGKEPMIRVLGKDPKDVVDKIIKIAMEM